MNKSMIFFHYEPAEADLNDSAKIFFEKQFFLKNRSRSGFCQLLMTSSAGPDISGFRSPRLLKPATFSRSPKKLHLNPFKTV